MALILVGYGNHLIPDWLQVAFLIHSHYDWLWQIIHYNRYQQPVLVHCTILWQGRDKMAPKCDVIMTTVAWISYSRERERWQRNQVQQKHLKITGRKKKKKEFNIWDRRALVCRFRGLLSRTLWSIDGLIAVGAGGGVALRQGVGSGREWGRGVLTSRGKRGI